jgi:hypothetical protein
MAKKKVISVKTVEKKYTKQDVKQFLSDFIEQSDYNNMYVDTVDNWIETYVK